MSGPTPVFVLSLPRSGSTLLQRLLAADPRVATTTEPWFLLPLVYSTRVEGAHTEYGQQTCAVAISELSAELSEASGGGWSDVVADCARDVYRRLSPEGTTHFVDKTPRYALITRELAELFPEARFVILWRNPLAAASSFTKTISEGNWRFWRNHVDLYDGVANLVDFAQSGDERVLTLRYEDLVTSPERELTRLGRHLELDLDAEQVTRDFTTVPIHDSLGDRWGATRFAALSAAPLDEWQDHYDTPVRRRWARQYLDWVGDERLAVMGYDRNELLDQISRHGGGRLLSDAIRAIYGSVFVRANAGVFAHSYRAALKGR